MSKKLKQGYCCGEFRKAVEAMGTDAEGYGALISVARRGRAWRFTGAEVRHGGLKAIRCCPWCGSVPVKPFCGRDGFDAYLIAPGGPHNP